MSQEQQINELNKQVGELIGTVKVSAETQKEVNAAIRQLIQKHDMRIDSLEKDRAKIKGVVIGGSIAGGGIFGGLASAISKYFGGA